MAFHFVTNIRSLASEAWSWKKDQLTIVALTFFIALVAISWFSMLVNRTLKKGRLPLPPGPPGLPFVGNLPFLGPDLHCHFAKLSQTYGPIMKLQLGRKTCIVMSSPSAAKEILKDQDAIFANRDVLAVGRVITYGVQDMVYSPCGPTWRMLRKICVREMMSKTSLDALYELRRCEIRRTISYINTKAEIPINIGDQMFITMLNLILNMLWGGTVKGEERESVGAEFRKVVLEIFDLFGKPNISDFFPILARFDLQGAERRMKKIRDWLDRIIDPIINQRLQMDIASAEEKVEIKECNDFLQILLRLKGEGDPKTPLTMTHIKVLIFDIVGAATDTTSTTLEWAMTELMLHPEIMRKVQEELEEVVGITNVVEESHLHKLQYLDVVLKEVHRLHPVAPLLMPRRPSESCIVGGYTVPEGSNVMVNVWAIHRDPAIWVNPLEFQPERFLKVTNDNKWDYSGNDYRYLPFGSGRRICVGVPLAEKMVPYTLASLIHSFDWSLPEGRKVDLIEKLGVTLKKETPLVAIPYQRLSNLKHYS